MKAFFITLLLSLTLPFAAFAAGGSNYESEAHIIAENVSMRANRSTPKRTSSSDCRQVRCRLAHLIAQMVNFIIVAVVLYKFAVKPIAATLDERQQKISEGLQYAEEMKTRSLRPSASARRSRKPHSRPRPFSLKRVRNPRR